MVKLLTWYISQQTNPKAYYRVRITDEIDKFKRKYPDRNPVLIVDFIGSISMLFDNDLEAKCAGRQGECIQRAEKIFRKFRECGVELAFFLDGPLKEVKFPEWCRRKNLEYENLRTTFQNLKHGERISLHFNTFLKSYYENYLRVAKKYGKVFISFENECDLDLAEYASRIQPMAVFAFDSDFLIMPGDWPIWLPKTFKADSFTVFAWNKFNLRTSLGLSQSQMPIFATLSGNDWIEYDLVKHIHTNAGGLFHFQLATLVNKQFPKKAKHIKSDIITDLIYNRGKCKLDRKEIDRLVKLSLDFYTYSTRKVTAITPIWLRDHIFRTAALNVFILYNKKILHIPQPYIDLSKNDVCAYSDLVLPILRREMGIMNYENQDDDIQYDVCLKPSDEEPYVVQKYSPIYPHFEVPSLEDILIEDGGGENDVDPIVSLEKKIEILGWIVSPPRKKPKLDIISKLLKTIFIIPAIVLNYLVQTRQITVDEADIVLLAIYETENMTEEKSKSLRPPQIILERPFWISFTYTNIVRHFEEAMIFCGLYKFIPMQYFDGFVFHKMYQKFLTLDFEMKKEILKPIIDKRLYVF